MFNLGSKGDRLTINGYRVDKLGMVKLMLLLWVGKSQQLGFTWYELNTEPSTIRFIIWSRRSWSLRRRFPRIRTTTRSSMSSSVRT